MSISSSPNRSSFNVESGHWLTLRREEPSLTAVSATEILARTTRELCAPFRYARTAAGVFLMAEYPLSLDDDAALAAQVALTKGLRQDQADHGATADGAMSNIDKQLDEGVIESSLAEFVNNWSRRDSAWIVPASPEAPVELVVRRVPGSVVVEATLAECDATEAVTFDAQAEFLVRAQAILQFARIELSTHVRVVSCVAASLLNEHLRVGVRCVAESCRLLAAEVRALSSAELARAYLAVIQE